MAREAPRGVRHLRRGRVELLVADELESAAVGCGLLEPDAMERAFASPAGHGRAPTARLELAPGAPRLHLRRLLHGGLLGPLLGDRFLGLARPISELALAQRLREAGVPVPRPALLLARRGLGPLRACAVGTVFEEGTLDAAELLGSAPEPRSMLRAAAAVEPRGVASTMPAAPRGPSRQEPALRERGESCECGWSTSTRRASRAT
jgi:3-deoxy-D-manno-octulosonic acid kinase